MKFTEGFSKQAIDWKSLSSHVGELGKALKSGVTQSGGQTVGSALKLKGLSNIGEAAKKAGGWDKAFSTSEGRKHLAEGIGKAAPSLAAGTAYAVGAKKVYDKTLGGSGNQEYYG